MKIPTFFIENFRQNEDSKSQLEKLLDHGTEKIVLRLYQKYEGGLSLYAFSGDKNHCHFLPGMELSTLSWTPLDITNKAVFLGDLEISGEQDMTTLRELTLNSKIEILILEPVGIDEEKYLIFEFKFSYDKTGHNLNKLDIRANPCPPCTRPNYE